MILIMGTMIEWNHDGFTKMGHIARSSGNEKEKSTELSTTDTDDITVLHKYVYLCTFSIPVFIHHGRDTINNDIVFDQKLI